MLPARSDRRDFHQQLILRYGSPAGETIRAKIVPCTHTERSEIAGHAELRALIVDAGIEDVAG